MGIKSKDREFQSITVQTDMVSVFDRSSLAFSTIVELCYTAPQAFSFNEEAAIKSRAWTIRHEEVENSNTPHLKCLISLGPLQARAYMCPSEQTADATDDKHGDPEIFQFSTT